MRAHTTVRRVRHRLQDNRNFIMCSTSSFSNNISSFVNSSSYINCSTNIFSCYLTKSFRISSTFSNNSSIRGVL